MGKTYRSWTDSDSDKRNSRNAKKHAKMKQLDHQKKRSKMKREGWEDYEY